MPRRAAKWTNQEAGSQDKETSNFLSLLSAVCCPVFATVQFYFLSEKLLNFDRRADLGLVSSRRSSIQSRLARDLGYRRGHPTRPGPKRKESRGWPVKLVEPCQPLFLDKSVVS